MTNHRDADWWDIYAICNAYESGVGKGRDGQDKPNPFPEDSREYMAYDIGYKEGQQQRVEIAGEEQMTLGKLLELPTSLLEKKGVLVKPDPDLIKQIKELTEGVDPYASNEEDQDATE